MSTSIFPSHCKRLNSLQNDRRFSHGCTLMPTDKTNNPIPPSYPCASVLSLAKFFPSDSLDLGCEQGPCRGIVVLALIEIIATG